MSIKKIGNITAKIGEYQKDGQTKGQYAKCGALFQGDDGRYSIKLDTIPLNFNGWLNVYQDEPSQQAPQQSSVPHSQANDFDSDTPF